MAQPKPKKGIREQFSALSNIPRFFRMIWGVSPRMAILNSVLRLLQAAIPVSMLYVGKIIIDTITKNTTRINPLPFFSAMRLPVTLPSTLKTAMSKAIPGKKLP